MVGKRVLIVDNEALIALDLAATLQAAGYVPIGPAHDSESALRLIIESGCDAAILDVHLGAGTVAPVADELARRRVPFLVLTGYAGVAGSPIHDELRQHASAPVLGKPVESSRLIGAVTALLGETDPPWPGAAGR